MKVPKWKLFQYREVYKITEMREGCVYKTKSLGYIHESSASKYGTDIYVLAPVSISMHKGDSNMCELKPWLG